MVSKFWHICLYDCAHRCERHLLFVSVLSVDRKLSVNRKWFVRQWNLLSVIRNYIADCVKVWVWVINNNTENTMLDARPASSETCQMMKSTLNQKPRLFTFIFVLLRPLKCFSFWLNKGCGGVSVWFREQQFTVLQYCYAVAQLSFSTFPTQTTWDSGILGQFSRSRCVGKQKHGGEVKGQACWGSERHSTSKTTVALTDRFTQFCLLPVLSVRETERGEVPLLFSGRKHICGTVTETEKRNLSGTLKYRCPSFPTHAHTPTSPHLQTISLLEITLQQLLWLHQGTRPQTVEYNELF